MDSGLFAKLLEIDLIQGDNNWENIKSKNISKILDEPRGNRLLILEIGHNKWVFPEDLW